MKEIRQFIINTSAMPSAKTIKNFTVEGDPGAQFTMTVINEDIHYYNFSEEKNKNGELKTAIAFSATPTTSPVRTIAENGVYNSFIEFPAITDDDHYIITLQAAGGTNLSKDISNNNVLVLPKIYKYKDTTVTFSLSSAGSSGSYNSMPSNVTFTGPSSSTPTFNSLTKAINWDVSLSTSQFVIARQPLITDFEFTTTKVTNSSSDSTGEDTYIELTDITGISPRMAVSGTNIAANSVVKQVIKGFKNYNKSSDLQDVYEIPKISSVNEDKTISIIDGTGGTIIISNASSWASGQTLTFTGKGSDNSNAFNNTVFTINNISLTIDPVVTTTDAAVDNSTTIPIASTDGIKASESVLMTGIGVTAASPHVDAISAGVNITASSAQTIENGQTVTFTGSSRNATITAEVVVEEYGTDDITLTLALDNILTVG
jgi:hypothetical protein|tara:strand:+ start:224 stop:1513 length:1290 start_codon:yes stop_codon:yes gene_type:complete